MLIAISSLRANRETVSLAELQIQKTLRDAIVLEMRAEMAAIHELMVPKWDALQRASEGPANLAQRLTPGGDNGK